MATEVTLPELGESVTEGTITAWLVSEGDTVEADQPIFELSSDKIDTEVPSPVGGVLSEIKVGVDETVDVGTVVAIIGEDGEAEGGAQATEEDEEAAAEAGEAADVDADDQEDQGQKDDEPEEAAPAAQQDDKERVKGKSSGEETEVILPELGESVTEGTITAWLVSEGDTVEADQPIFELSSDKIDTEVPSPVGGVLSAIKVDVDQTVDVGTVVAIIAQEAAAAGGAEAAEETEEAETAEEPEAPEPSGDGGQAGVDTLASPIVRRMISEHGLEADQISGSGKGGRITREDVEAAIAEQGKQPAAKEAEKKAAATPDKEPQPQQRAEVKAGDRERTEDLSRVRQRIAAKMMESMQSSAQLTTVQEADVTRIMNLRAAHKDEFKAREKVSLSPFVFLCRATVLALRRHEKLNAQAEWEAGKVKLHDYVNLGIAVDTERGLLVPNVKNADDLTLPALARAIAEAAAKARGKGKLEMRDIEGGTFTVTNTGSVGVLIDTPILNYPEVGILGTGAIKKRPVVIEDPAGSGSSLSGAGPAIAVRDMVYLCLTYDHRLVDGADAARFVTEVKEIIETHDWDGELGY